MSTGNISASALAKAGDKGYLSGELKTIADFAKAFPKASQNVDKVGTIAGTSPLDWALAMGTSNPALLAARPATRATILSKPYQAMMTQQSYGPSEAMKLLSAGANNPRLQALLPSLAVNARLKANE